MNHLATTEAESSFFRVILGVAGLLLIAYIFSSNRKKIDPELFWVVWDFSS